MHNILSELKVVPDNWVSVNRIQVAIRRFVGYLWLLCCSPSIFRTLCEEHSMWRTRRRKKRKRKIKFLSLTSTYRISNHLMQYIPHHIQTIMFAKFKSSVFSISTAVTEQYSCQNWFFLANLIAREYSSTRNGGKSLTWKNTIRMKTKQHCYYFSKTLVVGSIFHLHRVELNRLKVNYIIRIYFILMHVFG